MTANAHQIAQHFLAIKPADRLHWNWQCEPCSARGVWNVDDDTYINGCLLTLDFDYQMGYLLEIVKHESGAVSYLAVFEGPGTPEVAWHPEDCGTFFSRRVDECTVSTWAVQWIYARKWDRREGRVGADQLDPTEREAL